MPDQYRVEKLVRDLIPEVIRRDGREPTVRRVSSDEVRPFLALKIVEEAIETLEAFSAGDVAQLRTELADVLEVIDRMMALSGLTMEEIRSVQEDRAKARGRFDLNLLLEDPPGQKQRLYENAATPLLEAIKTNLEVCTHARMAVAFVMKSGVDLLGPSILAALNRGASIQLLTSDYMDVTDPEALAVLCDLPGKFDLRAYKEPSRSYHPKAYIFEHPDGHGMAFIGSSNMSASALMHGVEWNYEIQAIDDGWPLAELVDKFEALFNSEHSVPIDRAFIENYRQRRIPPQRFIQIEDRPVQHLLPRPAQVEALLALESLRAEGERKGLVVAATGIGKTFLAAFDSKPFARLLFLAHRDELLTQAQAAFLQVRPQARTGFYRGGEHNTKADILFASVSTLARPEHLRRFAPDQFDYVVIDEFHHAAAGGYRAVLHYFSPQFLLGLTATPYRADNRDVFALCDGNVAYRVSFIEAIALDWLCPFRYFGLYDETDFASVPWRNGRYDNEALSRAVENHARAAAILRAYRDHPSKAGVGFCVSIAHAQFMADYFSEHGVPSLAVHSGPGSVDRATAISKLRMGEVSILFTVDLFNEGVDIPEIDLVLFLRPTESPTIFLQQLGRGLRKHAGKAHLTALDFIGNYRKAHYKAALITGRMDQDPEPNETKKLLQEFASGQIELPTGVEVHFDLRVINLMQRIANEGEPRRQRLDSAFDEVMEELGHRPSMLELHRLGRFDVRQYRQEFGGWFRFLKSKGLLSSEEQELDSACGDFLLELEKTSMTRSYKMVLLQAFLSHGGLQKAVDVSTLVSGFRDFFLSSGRHRRDLLGTEIASIEQVSDDRLRAYLERNPIAAWTNEGKGGTRKVYFAYDNERGQFRYVGPVVENSVALGTAVAERIEFRLADYFEVRFERKNVFNVINAGDDRGIIMLGNDDDAPIPRNQGWKQVEMNGRRFWAKFAKIAINVLKDEPNDAQSVPNRLTEQLEAMFGLGGYMPQQGNRVRIAPHPEFGDIWSIVPFKK